MAHLKRLQVTHLRNLESVSLSLSPSINLFYGENGSGKTSLLEAVSVLGLGKSFRTHKSRPLIQHEYPQFTVFGEVDSAAVGIQKSRVGAGQIKINGDAVSSAAVLAQQLPLQIIDANTFQLIEGSPTQRRRFLDWAVFHVKPDFIKCWREFQRVIKQRNSLLKHGKIDRLQLDPWDREFAALSGQIHQKRQTVFEEFKVVFESLKLAFSGVVADVDLNYQPGWNQDFSIEEILKQDIERDCREGYTHHGPQRAEIKFVVGGKPATDVLSRGQEKTLICTLHIAQALYYKQKRENACVFLIDDLLAELDITNTQFLVGWLQKLGGQALVTGVAKKGLLSAWEQADEKPKLFHVKQGAITPDTTEEGIAEEWNIETN